MVKKLLNNTDFLSTSMNLDPQVSDLLSTQTQALNKMRRRLSNNQEVVYNEITREVM